MLTSDLDYDLPPDRIATQPADPRDSARLLLVRRQAGTVTHHRVADLPSLPDLFQPGDLMVFNRSAVLPAQFTGQRTGSGGRVKGLFLLEAGAGRWQVMLECRGSLRVGERIALDDQATLLLSESLGSGAWEAQLESDQGTLAVLQRVGVTPLPPYIRKQRRKLHLPEVTAADQQRYNTVYADAPGSVAAPTAGLHFTPALLAALDALGVQRAFVTLHVGMGTFAPIRSDRVEEHDIHREWLTVPTVTLAALAAARARGSRIIPVGTTTVRALESLPPDVPRDRDFVTETGLLISPGPQGEPYSFQYTDRLMTNFHLPRSSLLALVASLPGVGIDRLKSWYRLAIDQQYRFYSYGDAMLIA